MPAVTVPELRVVVAADHGHVLGKARVLPQVLRDQGSALVVKLAPGGVGKERAHFALLDVGHSVDALGQDRPALAAVGRQAAVHRKGHIKHIAELVPHAGRDKKPSLRVQIVLELTGHGFSPPALFRRTKPPARLLWDFDALYTTLPHPVFIIIEYDH